MTILDPKNPKDLDEIKKKFSNTVRQAQDYAAKKQLESEIESSIKSDLSVRKLHRNSAYKANRDELTKEGREMSRFSGYNDPQTMFASIMNFWKLYVDVLLQPVFDSLGDIKDELITNNAKFYWQLWRSPSPDIILPVITHMVELDSSGKLKENSLSQLGNVDITKQSNMQDHFELIVQGWLYSQPEQYVLDATDRTIKSTGGNNTITLDAAAFESLRDDPTKGLFAYFDNALKMKSEFKLQEPPSAPRP